MAKQPRRTSSRKTQWDVSIPLIVLGGFALGAGTTWLVMRGTTAAPEKPAIQDFTGAARFAQSPGASPFAPAAAAEPPDVSQLPPAEAARMLANWNYDHQNWAHAIEHYQKAITLGADTPDVRTDLGNCFRFLDQPQKALEQYEIAQKQNPQHENSLFNQISLYGDLLHNKERALAIGHEFITRFPQGPQAVAAKQLIDRFQAPQPAGK
ncbi:MAG TPA: tetratricopeptide repeat protein [Chthoniobacterales bacterium]|jgi:tetratricopeptide (TPR) repeat protein|nr:tetratricopeptide repeat protein [Chthoniobacterales bacterium]